MDTKKSLKNNKIFIIAIFAVAVFFFRYNSANAATLQISSSSATLSSGRIMTFSVILNSEGVAVNNAEAKIMFPKDLLEIVSVSKSASIFSWWIEEPSFSNSTGIITFNGGVPTPGFTGSNGAVITFVARAKKTGQAEFIFSDAAVRANDGLGTDILSNKIGLNINISSFTDAVAPPTASDQEKVAPSTVENSALTVTSISHPNQNIWYSKNNADLSWILPENAEAIKTLLDSQSNSKTSVYYATPISHRNIKNIEEGIRYFHINYMSGGVWSRVAHYRLKIDVTSPKNISINTSKDTTGKVALNIKSEDALSGIDHYVLIIDSQDPITMKSDSNGEAFLDVPFLSPGKHALFVTAFDKAGNTAETKTNITTDIVSNILRVGSYTTIVLSVLVPTITMSLILLFLVYYGGFKFLGLRRRLKRDFKNIEKRIHDSFHTLYQEASKQINAWEKSKTHKKISKEGQEAIDELKSAMVHIDKYIEKQIHKIEEENS